MECHSSYERQRNCNSNNWDRSGQVRLIINDYANNCSGSTQLNQSRICADKMSILESFFDSDLPNFKLWSKGSENIDISQEKRLYAGRMHKSSKQNGKWKERFFVLTDKHLVYYKDSSEDIVRGIMPLDYVRNEYIKEGHPTRAQYTHGIRFIKNMKYSDLWLSDEHQFTEWKVQLSKVCVQSDFHIKFNAVKMIGKGSFARVYLVENKEDGTRSAVKAFSKEYLLSQNKGKESLINEIQIMKDINHQYIMQLLEIHESQNSIYLVLELLEGGELFNHVYKKGQLTIAEYNRTMRCLLEALAYMDQRGIMHRDLKPENMILKHKGEFSLNQNDTDHLKMIILPSKLFVDVDIRFYSNQSPQMIFY